jgi:hypothetical protein
VIYSLTLGASAPTTLEFQNVSNTAVALMVATNVSLKGACTIQIIGTNNLVSGVTYPLVNYSGTFTGNFGNFTLQMPSGWAGNLVSNAHQIAVSVVSTPAVPAGLSATAGDARAVLAWNAVATATGYYLKRATTNGGAYTVVVGNYAATSFTNTALANGTIYYYVVTATNAAGESASSPQVSVQPISSAPVAVNVSVNNGLLQINWPPDHTGWLLQAQTNQLDAGLGTNWLTVAGSNGSDQYTNVINPANGSVFFRLVHP